MTSLASAMYEANRHYCCAKKQCKSSNRLAHESKSTSVSVKCNGFRQKDIQKILINNQRALLGVPQVGFYVLEGAKDLDAVPSVSGCRLHDPNWACQM